MPSTPSTPATPHRRSRALGIRRPRVAGRTAPVAGRQAPSGHENTWREDPRRDDGGTVDVLAPLSAEPDTAEPDTAGVDLVKADPAGHGLLDAPEADVQIDGSEPADATRPSGKRGRGRRRLPALPRTRRRIPTLVLVGALVVLTAAAVFFGIAGVSLRSTPAAQNSALVDVGATAQVTQQLGDAMKAAYSYDFARLDQNEAAAKAGIVPNSTFMTQYEQLFTQVRQLAPQQQAVVTATISTSAVREITGDRAVVVMFLDQQITRVEAGNQPRQDAAAARLTVTGQLVDGVWKITDLQVL